MSFFDELKRRNVFKVAVVYIIASWLLLQVSATLVPALYLPEWFDSGVAFLLIIGFPIALIFAWAFEMTPDGLRREKEVDTDQSLRSTAGAKLNRIIVFVLVLALAYFVFDKFVLDPKRDAELIKAVQTTTEQTINSAETVVEADDSDNNSIAVLPFLNMSSDPEQEYFSDGITEEVLNMLVKIPELKVTSRSSVFTFKGQNVDIPTVAAKLGVAHILEGSVRKAGNRVRVTAQLIKADTDVHLWSETYERELDDIFAIQDEIATEVVKALKIQLIGETPHAISTSIEAYNLYLKGKHFASQYTTESLQSSIKVFRQAIALDAKFAPPWGGLAESLRIHGMYGSVDKQETLLASRNAAERALELDSELAEAWMVLARIQYEYDWDWARAEATIRTALKYEPQNARVLRSATWVALTLGEAQRALGLAQLAVDLDPLDYSGLSNLGTTYWALGQPKDEERIYRRILELYPEATSVKSWLAAALTVQGYPEEGLQYLDFDSDNVWQKAMSAVVLHSLGRHEEEQQMRQRMIDKEGQLEAFRIALTYAWHGDSDKAFEWLDIAFERRDALMTQLIFNPWLVSLHDDPRWLAILQKMGLLRYWNKSQALSVSVDHRIPAA